MRSILRPGTHVLRRADGRLQVGLDPARRLLLPDTEHSRRLADPLRVGDAGDEELRPLREAGLVVDESTVRRREAPRVRIGLQAFGHRSSQALTRMVREQLADLGLPAPVGEHARTPDVVLLVGVGEPHRELLDPLLRDGVTHCLLRFVEGVAVLGPWVVPGVTPCQRCLDAHHTDTDPSWPVLVHQYAEASSRDRADGLAEPVDPALAAIATAWLCRDLAGHTSGATPSTWASTVHLPADLAGLELRSWLRHPECGCSGV